MSDEYPTSEQLDRVEKWPVSDVTGLIEYVRGIWWMPDWGFMLKGKRVLYLQLHTGGWSGNEDIMESLTHNYIFWSLCWRKHTAGGHYWFRINLHQFQVVGAAVKAQRRLQEIRDTNYDKSCLKGKK